MDGVYSLKTVGSDIVGNQYNNVMHYFVDTTGAQSAIDTAFDLVTAWLASVRTDYLACLPLDVFLTYVASRMVDNPGQPTAVKAITPSDPGTRPSGVSVLAVGPQISLFGAAAGNRVGKIFIPGVAQGDVLDGRISAELATAIDTLQTTIMAPLVLAGGGSAKLAIWAKNVGTGFLVSTTIRAPKLAVLGRRIKPTL